MQYKQDTMEEEIESIKSLIVYIINHVTNNLDSETPFEWTDITDIDVKIEGTHLDIVSFVKFKGVKTGATTRLAIESLGEGIVDYWLNFDLNGE